MLVSEGLAVEAVFGEPLSAVSQPVGEAVEAFLHLWAPTARAVGVGINREFLPRADDLID
jgi:hypothetical protein